MGSNSALGVALQLSNRGLLLKLRVQRYGHRLLLPIYLAAAPSAWEIILATVMPGVSGAFTRVVVLSKFRRRRLLKERQAQASEAVSKAKLAAEIRRAAELDTQLLLCDAVLRAEEEEARGGLVIIAAFYGDVQAAVDSYGAREAACLDASGGGSASGRVDRTDSLVSPQHGVGWLDVSVPLQYAVVESSLVLPPKSKQALRGFADPATTIPPPLDEEDGVGGHSSPGMQSLERGASPVIQTADGVQAPQLWVRYKLAGQEHTVLLADEQPLAIRL